ncbi:hypothetical protein KE502_03395 [Clostridiaceae bacterium Marseille-Q3526]|nr:hypothetical protein [Clostridiaceae bacterium Marseille-Q3526]
MAMGIWLPGGGGADLDAVTASAGDVLAGKVIVGPDGEPLTGTMPERGSWNSSELAAGASVTIPGGHHSGSGKVTAKSLSAQTSGTATAAQILSGKTAWVNGSEVTGSMANRGNYGGTGNSRGNDTSGQRMWVKVPGGYYNENAQVFLNWADIRSMAGLTPDKIKKNVSIMGITGTFEGFIPGPYDVYNRGSWGIGYGTKSISGSSPTFELSNIFISSKASSGFMIFISKQGSDIVMQPYRTINIVFDSDLGAFPDVNVIELSVGNMSISTTPSKTEKTISLDITGINSAESITFSGGGRNGSTYCNIYRIYFT